MESLQAFNLEQWIEANRAQLQPPVGNKRVFRDGDFIIMVVGGPNARQDYHVDPGQEFFYQLEGDMLLKTMQDGRAVDVPIREGEVLLIPSRLPHSPQRRAHTEPRVYLCGQSLGLMPLAAGKLVAEELDDWAGLGVLGHEHARRPWIPYHENLTAGLAYLTGARMDEVVAMNSLTVNLHLM